MTKFRPISGRSSTSQNYLQWHQRGNGNMKKFWSMAVALSLAASAVILGGGTASADTAPVDPTSPATPVTVSADALPTVQIDGVVWQQVVVGNTVYAAGNFQTARPAGAAPGTNTQPRSNILAYDIRTGILIPGFAPVLNGEARAITASPDGSRIYVGGVFTQVNGTAVSQIAALNPATGALITSFMPRPNSRVNAIVATNNTVYAGGWFNAIWTAPRTNLAAFNAADGALLPWNPAVAGGAVEAMVLSPDQTKLVVGGSFTSLNGSAQPGYGLGAVSTDTGALVPFGANSLVRNGGTAAAITSLASSGDQVYGTGYVFGSGGNLEGAFSANWSDGAITWLEDCHGDTYGIYPSSTAVYVAGHPHFCGDVGGFPQTSPDWTFHHSIAFSKAATGTVGHNPFGGYYDFAGTPAPSLLNWFPDWTIGTFTGQSQAPWTVQGNDQYVVFGGEFTAINGVRQQGLVRFATKDIAPNKQGPMVTGTALNPSILSLGAGTVRIGWQSNWDRDNTNLKYDVIRDGNTATPVYSATAISTFWNRPAMGFQDSGLVPGSTHTYRLKVTDPLGNVAQSDVVSVTVATTGSLSTYANDVLSDSAGNYWRLGEASGSTAVDWAGWSDAVEGAGVTQNVAGAIVGDANSAATFSGTSTGTASTQTAIPGPDVFTMETWIKTTTTKGGKILGFGNASSGLSTSYDRQIYMNNAGQLVFGVYTGATQVLTTSAKYNDGAWHQVVASMGSSGMVLYVDGLRVGQRADVTSGQPYSGYWRIGGDNLSSWPTAPTSSYFSGVIDEVSIYPSVLSLTQIQKHFVDSGRTLNLPPAPTDAYGKAIFQANPDLYWRVGESNGTTAADSGPFNNPGTYVRGVTLGRPGAINGTTNTAVRFNGTSGLLSSNAQFSNPTTYSEELWFNTTTKNGGKLIGFGDVQTGVSNSYDRHVYMETSGALTFGTYTGQTNTITSTSKYNDGTWHHMVATQGADGMKLYVDGALVGTNPQTAAQAYNGYWKVGGDTTWGPQPYFSGTIDEVAVYSTALTAAVVANHYAVGSGNSPVNQPPVAAFTATPTNLVVAFNGSGSSDPDGSVASYSWNFGDGTAAGTGATPSHTYAAAGTYQVALTVTDNLGLTNTLTKAVVATAVPNVAPVAAFTATPTNLVVAFDGSGSSDPDGTVASYSWNFGDATAAGTGATPSHTYAAAGTYQVALTVTDNLGLTNTLTKAVAVTAAPPVNQPPVAAFTATPTNLVVAFDGSGSSDPDGTVASYSWNFGDATAAGTGATPSHTYAAAGTYQVALTVTDNLGLTNTLTKAVAVTAANVPPVASFMASAVGLLASFDASASIDSDGTVASYSWNYGDATAVGTGKTPTHSYATAGTYQVKLTVTDNAGATGTMTQSITVGVAAVPRPDHTVVVVMENKSEAQIIGSPDAPFINSLAAGGAEMTNSFAVTHPSQPNYLALFAGSTLGLTDDSCPNTYSATNLAGQLAGKGLNFVGYSESLPSVGFQGCTSPDGLYARKHSPWVNFPALPTSVNQPMTAFPTDYSTLPTVSFVIPNLQNDMHDGTVAQGDAWLQANIGPYVAWAKQHNSLLILTWDEDDFTPVNQISTVIAGQRVQAGQYSNTIDHYSVLRTIQDAYGLASNGNTASATPITNIWAPLNVAPVAAFTATPTNLVVAFDGSGSTDPDGTVASYSWNFGDGTAAGTAAKPSHTYAAAGTYQVALTVTDNLGLTNTLTKAVTVTAAPPGNVAPVAAFTATPTNLVVAFDGSGSTDPDGTIASYSWTFGDATAAGTGATPSHTYVAAGTYQVALTVTDNLGLTNTLTKAVTVTATPPVNVAPVAAFGFSSVDLVASFDGSGSSDPDGTVASFSWNFGDGTAAGTGAKPGHTYAAAGSYSVTLTVTDNLGLTNAVTKTVAVTAPSGIFAQDNFARTVAAGFGSADIGGPWSVDTGAGAVYSVTGGVASMQNKPGMQPSAIMNGVSSTSTDMQVTYSLDRLPSAGNLYLSVIGRKVGTTGDYRAKIGISASGAVTLYLSKFVGSTETLLGGVALASYVAGDKMQVRLQVSGTSPTIIRAKVWKSGTTEPSAWNLSTTDSQAGLQTAGAIGFVSYLSGSSATSTILRFEGLAAKPVQ